MSCAKLPAMKNILRETNPAEKWLEQRFQIEQQFADGHLLVLRFDLKSTGLTGYRFTALDVAERFGQHILADPVTDYGEHLNIAAIIAGVLNEKMDRVALEVFEHIRMSLLLLDALDAQDAAAARLIGVALGERLVAFGAQADHIWGDWLLQISGYLHYL